MRIAIILAASALFAGWYVRDGATLRLACIADANLSSYETETRLNYGASSRIRLKGIQMLGVFRFDTTPIAGAVVESARLHLRYAGNDRRLRTLGFSTVAVPWTEGAGSGEELQGALCFAAPELGRRRWTTPDSDFTDAAFLPGASIVSYADIRNDGDGWISAEVHPRIVQAMVAGLSHGMAVTDEKGQTMANNDVYSREQAGSAPYLTVGCRPALPIEQLPPGRPSVKLSPAPAEGDLRGSAVQTEIEVGPGSLGVEARLRVEGNADDRPVPLAVLGLTPTGRANAVLDALPGGKRVALAVRAVGVTGTAGPFVSVEAVAPPAMLRPPALRTPAGWTKLVPAPIRLSGPARVSVHSGLVRSAPGREELDTGPGLDRLWDGRSLRLSACRGERLSVTVAVRVSESASLPVAVVAAWDAPSSALRNQAGRTARVSTAPIRSVVYRVAPVMTDPPLPDLCVPLPDGVDRSSGPHGSAAAFRQYLVELDVGRTARTGVHRGTLIVRYGAHPPAVWQAALDVGSHALPARPAFEVSLNTYGSPARASGRDPASPEGIAAERAYHRLAFAHRCTLAPLGYSHAGTIEPGYAPELAGEGSSRHVRDWSSWDSRFGPYLSGQAFVGLSRTIHPITHMYLPFHEAWPEDIRRHYAYQPSTRAYPDIIADHALLAGPIETMLSAEYRDGYRSTITAFAEHLRASRWAQTRFHFYLNNKYYYRDPAQGGRGTSWWLLDEPMHRDDWLALAYYARILKDATSGLRGHGIIFRADISRPQWQRDYLDGLVDLMVVNDEMFARPTVMRQMRRRLGATLWHYGEAPAPHSPLADFARWPIRAYLAGADGIVPWQSIGTRENSDRPSATGLIVPGEGLGLTDPVAAIRLKALAQGAQDAELIAATASARGWTRDQCAAALDPYVRTGDWRAMRASLHEVLRQSSAAIQSAQSRGQTDTAPARRARPNP